MPADLETLLRGSKSYDLARATLQAMESRKIWPTLQNFEIWLHYAAANETPLGKELDELVARNEPFTEELADQLAARHLPKGRLNGELLTAGNALSKELDSVAKAIESARETSEAYGAELAEASQALQDQEPGAIKAVVEALASATQRVQRENQTLEDQLADTNAEVMRLREHLEMVRRDSMTDGLTQLANRKAFDEALDRALVSADAGLALALAVIDIDHFKAFNDTWGHQTGDQVLRVVASVIGRFGQGVRTAARYGGEEFALILPGDDARSAYQMLEQIREEVGTRTLKRRSTNEDLGTVTISIGLAERVAGETAAMLIERADEALYASKRSGRNRTTTADQVEAAA